MRIKPREFIVLLALSSAVSFSTLSCSSGEKDLSYKNGEKFEEVIDPPILWRVVLLSPSGHLVKQWHLTKKPTWSGGEVLRCYFYDPITGANIVSKYTYIEPYYATEPKDSIGLIDGRNDSFYADTIK